MNNVEICVYLRRNKGHYVQILTTYKGTEYSLIEIKEIFGVNGGDDVLTGRVS